MGLSTGLSYFVKILLIREYLIAESQLTLNEQREAMLGKFVELFPDLALHLNGISDEAYKEGALSSKTKRLMALAIALGVGCTNCELGQTMNATDFYQVIIFWERQ